MAFEQVGDGFDFVPALEAEQGESTLAVAVVGRWRWLFTGRIAVLVHAASLNALATWRHSGDIHKKCRSSAFLKPAARLSIVHRSSILRFVFAPENFMW